MRLRCRLVGCLRETPWYGYVVVCVAFTVGLLLPVALLTLSDKDRQIQRDRVDSCRATYEGVREVFQPFLASAPPGDVRTFNRRVDALKARCGRQTGVHKEER